ncbi:hypothetical protein ACVWZ6_002334 [Bradyrhizobium sp. GM6.1]
MWLAPASRPSSIQLERLVRNPGGPLTRLLFKLLNPRLVNQTSQPYDLLVR